MAGTYESGEGVNGEERGRSVEMEGGGASVEGEADASVVVGMEVEVRVREGKREREGRERGGRCAVCGVERVCGVVRGAAGGGVAECLCERGERVGEVEEGEGREGAPLGSSRGESGRRGW